MKSSDRVVLVFNDIRDDDHIWIKDAVTELGYRCIALDQARPFDGDIYIDIDNGRTHIELKGEFKSVKPSSVVGVWHRWYLPSHASAPGTRDAFIQAEWKYFWKFIAQSIVHPLWMNSVHAIEKSADRLGQLEVARSVGLRIPRTAVAIEPSDIASFIERVGGNGVCKVLGSGRPQESPGKKLMAKSLTASQLEGHERYEAPALVQEMLEIDLEIRCTVVGDQVFCAAIDPIDGHLDIKHAILAGNRYKRIVVPQQTVEKLVQMVRMLDLRYAAIDLGLTKEGELIFLELNPSGMYQNIEVDTAFPITEAIAQELTQRKCG